MLSVILGGRGELSLEQTLRNQQLDKLYPFPTEEARVSIPSAASPTVAIFNNSLGLESNAGLGQTFPP